MLVEVFALEVLCEDITPVSTSGCPLHNNCSLLLQLALVVLSCLHTPGISTHTIIINKIHCSFVVHLQNHWQLHLQIH